VKTCGKCKTQKPLTDFHRQPSGRDGRHSWCAACFNAAYRGVKRKPVPAEVRRRHNLKSRYGLTAAEVSEKLTAQNGLCGICANPPVKAVVDHCHSTGKVRGILCHTCNIALPHVENEPFRQAALSYLKAHS